MYNFISGRVAFADENLLVVDAGGIGYEIIATARCMSELGQVGGIVKVYTHLHVREDDMSLYGFVDKKEKSFFLQLTSISGIGPKVAINILSSAKLDDIMSAIATGDVAALGKIKGIGKKTAERLVLELKDKIGADFAVLGQSGGIMSGIVSVNDDAVSALMSLGYNKNEATLAVAKVEKSGMSVEQIIMQALKGV